MPMAVTVNNNLYLMQETYQPLVHNELHSVVFGCNVALHFFIVFLFCIALHCVLSYCIAGSPARISVALFLAFSYLQKDRPV